MDHFPGDMVYEIMRRLQGPDIVRFGRACKRFWAIYEKNSGQFTFLKVIGYFMNVNKKYYYISNNTANINLNIYFTGVFTWPAKHIIEGDDFPEETGNLLCFAENIDDTFEICFYICGNDITHISLQQRFNHDYIEYIMSNIMPKIIWYSDQGSCPYLLEFRSEMHNNLKWVYRPEKYDFIRKNIISYKGIPQWIKDKFEVFVQKLGNLAQKNSRADNIS